MSQITIYEPDNMATTLSKSLDAPPIDPVMLSVANDVLAGKDIDTIANSTGIGSDLVTQILDKKEVKSYMDTVMLSQGYANRSNRLKLINRVIEQKIEEAMETGVYSKKDLLDWLKHLNDVEDSIRPKDKGPAVAVQINNNYDNLMKDLLNG